MRRRSFGCAFLMAILSLVPPLAARDVDAIITSENRKAATIADEIHDPAERAAFLALFAKDSAEKKLALAQDFLLRYRQSAFLAMAYEIAARSSFDLGDRKSGLDQAHQSLVFLPENRSCWSPSPMCRPASTRTTRPYRALATFSITSIASPGLSQSPSMTGPRSSETSKPLLASSSAARSSRERSRSPPAQPGQLFSIRPRPPSLRPVLSTSPMLRSLTCLARTISSPMI